MAFRFSDLRYLNLPRLGSSLESHTEMSGPFSQNVDFYVSFTSGELQRSRAILGVFSQLGVQHRAYIMLWA